MTCPFCDIVSGTGDALIVFEDDDHLAFLDSRPEMPGHTLVVPKQHAGDAFKLSRDAFHKLMDTTYTVAQLLQTKTGCERVFEKIIGIEVDHIHVHLMPYNAPKLASLDRSAVWRVLTA